MINIFDLFAVVVTIGLAALGFREGLVRGAIRLIGFIALVIATVILIGPVLDISDTAGFIPRSAAAPIFVIVFLVIGMIAIHIVSAAIHKIIHMTPVGFIDYSLGCAFGILKALFLCGLLAIALSLAPQGGFFRTQYEESFSAGRLISFMSEAIPPVKKIIQPYYRRFAPPPDAPERNNDNDTQSSDFI